MTPRTYRLRKEGTLIQDYQDGKENKDNSTKGFAQYITIKPWPVSQIRDGKKFFMKIVQLNDGDDDKKCGS